MTDSTTNSPGSAGRDRSLLVGSERSEVGTITGAVPDDATVQATIVLRRCTATTPPAHQLGATPLTRDSLAEAYGAQPDDVALLARTLAAHDVRVIDTHAGSRRVRVEGTASALASLFGTKLHRINRDDSLSQQRMRSGSLSLPGELDGLVTAVLGLDDRPQAFSRIIFAGEQAGTSYTPLEIAQLYQLPDGDGTGQTIAVIELGGGFAQSDLDTYFQGLGLTSPKVTAQSVDGAENQPGKDPNGADGEVLLDIEVAGAIAPKADIVVYFAPNTDDGFLDAISTAAHADPTPAAISISWGQSEDAWTAQSRQAMDQAIADAVGMGITVCCAAGDNGSSDAGSGVHVDFPASSPSSLGCGGTTLQASGSTISSETAWNDGGQGGATGGGVSDAFPLPDWQSDVGVPDRSGTQKSGRGVPDVSANADPQTGYQVYVDGKQTVVGGTSAVAPLWAGLIARLAQRADGPLGALQPKLYAGVTAGKPAPGLRDITSGNNGAYQSGPGWDACTGLGVPQSTIAGVFSTS
jgi:kumamolisin